MSKQSHTPGPWRVEVSPEYPSLVSVVRADETELEASFALSRPVEMADAHLIAAAPEMLEALKALLPYGQSILNDYKDSDDSPLADAMKAARAAIQKAEGRAE